MSKSALSWVRRSARVIRMVSELHRMGYQRLRIMPHQAPLSYRVLIAPAQAFSRINGALCVDFAIEHAGYTVADEDCYFEWTDAKTDNARALAEKFVDRFPRVCELGRGSDWAYAGWLADLLGQLEQHPDKLPHIDLTEFSAEQPETMVALPLRRIPGAGPETTPYDVLFPLPPIPA